MIHRIEVTGLFLPVPVPECQGTGCVPGPVLVSVAFPFAGSMGDLIPGGCPPVLPHTLMALSGTGGPGVATDTGNSTPGLKHDTAGPGVEVHQIGKTECFVYMADPGPAGAYRPSFVIAFRPSAGKNRYGWMP